VQLYPEWDYSLGERQIRSEHRSRSGRMWVYKWSDYTKINFKLNWVPASNAALVNSWWHDNAELLWFVTSDSTTEVHSVYIINDERPLAAYNKPYVDYYKGAIELETY
jgi:hypothetical protein